MNVWISASSVLAALWSGFSEQFTAQYQGRWSPGLACELQSQALRKDDVLKSTIVSLRLFHVYGKQKRTWVHWDPYNCREFSFLLLFFSNNMNHTIQLGYQNRILKGWTPPTRKMVVIALPLSIPVTGPAHHRHLFCWGSPTERHWRAQGLLCPIYSDLCV